MSPTHTDSYEAEKGEAASGAAARRTLSIGPSRNGEFVAKPWRIWSQGDEFYAAQRDAVNAIKVSFHSTEWHVDAAQQRTKLAAPIPLSLPGWSLALQLWFLVPERPMVSPILVEAKESSNVVSVDTPAGAKLVVNLLCAPPATMVTSQAPLEVDGVRFMAMQLRSKGTVVVTAALLPLDRDDLSLMTTTRGIQFNGTAKVPVSSNPNVEHVLADLTDRGNLIRVVPFVAEDIKMGPQASSAQT